MLIVSDVHGNVEGLRRVSQMGEPLVVLGDLINYIDYRTADGILADIAGNEWVRAMIDYRTESRWGEVQAHWEELRSQRGEETLREEFRDRIEEAYSDICQALAGAESYVTFGNVDRPDRLKHHLPDGATFVESGIVELEGLRFGIVGGGVASRLGVPGELSDEELAARLAALGPVDVLGTHVPPAISQLSTDVVAGTDKGSQPVLDYLKEHQPSFHFFGDIHQPQASSWHVGKTLSCNVGYFRATGRAFRFAPNS